jgi:hypothetical protein
MAIKNVVKKINKGQAIIDLRSQIKDSLNVINSVVLNSDAAVKAMKKDSDFTLDEIQEYVNIIIYALNETQKMRKSWQEIFNAINLG